MKILICSLSLVAFLFGSACGDDAVMPLKAIDGTTCASLKAENGKKAVVLFFISPLCPTSNTFGPEMTAISAKYGEDFAFRYIHSDLSVGLEVAVQHARMNAIKDPVLMDEGQRLAKKLGARITPEVVVVDATGKTVYQGRINNLYLGPTDRQREATVHDLRDALEAMRSGKPAPTPRTDAIGCNIEGLD